MQARLTRLEDIEAIKKLQRAYGYYLEHWQEDQIIDLCLTVTMSRARYMIPDCIKDTKR